MGIESTSHITREAVCEMNFSDVWGALFGDQDKKVLMEIKSGLMDEIRQYLKRENLTQEKAAEVLGVSCQCIGNILAGKISMFTAEELQRISDGTRRIERNSGIQHRGREEAARKVDAAYRNLRFRQAAEGYLFLTVAK